MRDGLEDYEYFYLSEVTSSQPQPYQRTLLIEIVDNIISDIAAYNRDSELLYNLRRLVGMKIAGEIPSIPELFPLYPDIPGQMGYRGIII